MVACEGWPWGGPHFSRGGHGVDLGIGFVLGFVCIFGWGGRWGGHGVAKFSVGVAMGWPSGGNLPPWPSIHL